MVDTISSLHRHATRDLAIHLSGVAAMPRARRALFHLPIGYDPLLTDTNRKFQRDIEICLLAGHD